MKEEYRKLYNNFVRLQTSREEALSLTLVKMGLKDATTVRFDKKLALVLKNKGYIYELDKSYLKKSIYNFVECTTSVRLPGAKVIRRLYVSKRFSRQRLRQLRSGSSFEQGLAFGFPICDILGYCRKEKKEGKTYIEIFKDWLERVPSKNSIKYIDFRLMGNLIKYFQSIRLIVHIPCKNDCRASLELADRNLNILENLDYSFKNYLVEEFKRPLLLYGNNWEDIGVLRLAKLKKQNRYLYTAICSSSLPSIIPGDALLKIKLIPHKKVEVYLSDKMLIQQESPKDLRWSYCFIFPYDSTMETLPEKL